MASKFSRFLIVGLVVLMAIIGVMPAAAHEHREVGPYGLAAGWQNEPAYAGQINGPEIFIDEHETETPIEGAEETLTVEVIFGGQSVTLNLRPVFGEPGHYKAALIPTRPGDYTFHFVGTIGETAIDETFTSADGEFSAVEPASDILFPDVSAPTYELETRITDLETKIAELEAIIEELKGN